MRQRFPDFTSVFDFHRPDQCPNRYCRVHFYWSFDLEMHLPFPEAWWIKTSTHGWVNVEVFCGPGAWEPRSPTPDQWSDMRLTCPHVQIDLTCNFCLRHTFHPLELT